MNKIIIAIRFDGWIPRIHLCNNQWTRDKDGVRVCNQCGEIHSADLHNWFWRQD